MLEIKRMKEKEKASKSTILGHMKKIGIEILCNIQKNIV
jgi:hypothetical protein